MQDDAYAGLCIHGTLPLVPDPGSASGIRLARPGHDLPSACISNPALLPDAEMSLRAFTSTAERDGYVAALADVGGNAFSVLASPDNATARPFALVVRHDRERSPAATLDEAVRLDGSLPNRADWARYRRGAQDDVAAHRYRSTLRERWAAHRAALPGRSELWLSNETEAGIEFMSSASRSRFTLGGEAEPTLSWTAVAYRFDADLEEMFASGLRQENVESPAVGRYRIVLAELSEAEIRRAIDVERRIGALEDRLSALSVARTKLAEVHAHASSMVVLKRAVAGLPVITRSAGEPGAQMNARTGAAQNVPGVLLSRLVNTGLMTLAWKRSTPLSAQDPLSWCPEIYIATPAAALVVEGRLTEAADAVGCIRMPKRDVEPLYAGSLLDALGEISARTAPEHREAAAAITENHLPEDGSELAWAVGHGQNFSGWMPVVIGSIAGSIIIDSDLRVRIAHTPQPVPRM